MSETLGYGLLMSWVCCLFASLHYGWLDPFFWAAENAHVQGIDYFALPKSFLNLWHHQSLYDSWHGVPYGPYATWYLAHPLFSILIMPWFAFLSPWVSYVTFVLFSFIIIVWCATLFAQHAVNRTERLMYYALFLGSFPLYWMCYVGNMHAPLVLAFTLIYLAIYDIKQHGTHEKKYHLTLLLGLLCSFFTKPIVIFFIPALLMVKETRRTMVMALLIYAIVSFLFIVIPFLNPEGVGLSRIGAIIFDFDSIKEHLNIYKNNFVLTPLMKDNSIHWLNLIAQSGFRLNHIENFSFPVFLDTALGRQLPSAIYNIPLYFCFLSSLFIGFVRQRMLRLQVLLLILMMTSMSFFLSYTSVWEYQFISVCPLMALIFLERKDNFFSKIQLKMIIVIGVFFYLPSTYVLLHTHITLSTITLIRASRAIPALLLYLLLAYQTTKILWHTLKPQQHGAINR